MFTTQTMIKRIWIFNVLSIVLKLLWLLAVFKFSIILCSVAQMVKKLLAMQET